MCNSRNLDISPYAGYGIFFQLRPSTFGSLVIAGQVETTVALLEKEHCVIPLALITLTLLPALTIASLGAALVPGPALRVSWASWVLTLSSCDLLSVSSLVRGALPSPSFLPSVESQSFLCACCPVSQCPRGILPAPLAAGQLAGEGTHITPPSQAIEIETLATESRKAKRVDPSSKSGKTKLKEAALWARAGHLAFPDKPPSIQTCLRRDVHVRPVPTPQFLFRTMNICHKWWVVKEGKPLPIGLFLVFAS